MPTTYSPTFKNGTINSLTGRAATGTYTFYYIQPFSGAQPADPTVAPAGVSVFTGYSTSIATGTFMSQPASGISALGSSRSASAANAVTATFARCFDQVGAAMVDVLMSVPGGGGGVIAASMVSSVGVAYQIDQFSMKVPLASGTILMNTALANAIASAWCVTPATIGLGSSASILVYSGAAPATADTAATGTLLATFSTGATGVSWNAASAGSAALAAAITVAATATGTAGYVRIVKGTYVLQGSAGTTGTDFILSTVSLVAATNVSLTDATIAM